MSEAIATPAPSDTTLATDLAAPAAPVDVPAVVALAQPAPVELTEAQKAEAVAKDAVDAKTAADALKNESPEQKATREAQEAVDKAKALVPEKYELKTSDGKVADEADTSEFTALAKEFKLPQDAAQRLFDMGNKAVQGTTDHVLASIKTTQDSWLAASKSDKEFGGDKLDANMAIAQKALALSPEVKTLLRESKLGNHPELIRWMYRVGLKLSEDTNINGRQSAETTDLANRLYPSKT